LSAGIVLKYVHSFATLQLHYTFAYFNERETFARSIKFSHLAVKHREVSDEMECFSTTGIMNSRRNCVMVLRFHWFLINVWIG